MSNIHEVIPSFGSIESSSFPSLKVKITRDILSKKGISASNQDKKQDFGICKLIKLNKQQCGVDPNANVLISTISTCTLEDMVKCAEVVKETHPDTLVMLLSTRRRSILIVAIVPSNLNEEGEEQFDENLLLEWINKSSESVCVPGTISSGGYQEDYPIYSREISFSALSNDYDPEKLVDQVRTNSFSFLKTKGLYSDPPEEKEYTFDDLDF